MTLKINVAASKGKAHTEKRKLVSYSDVKTDKNSPRSLLESRFTTVPKKCYLIGNQRMVEVGKDL